MREENRIELGRNRPGFGLAGRISWSAIFAGAAVTLAVSLLLALLGAGLGASSLNPLQQSNPLEGLGKVAIFWLVISGIVAFFAGGWTAGYGSGWITSRRESLVHGFVTWAVTSLVAASFITGAAGSLLAGGAGLIGQSAKAAAQSPQLSSRLQEELQKRGIDLNSLQQQAQSPETQAKAEQAARQAGEKVAKGVSAATLGAFGMLLLDLISSLLGATAAAWSGPGPVVPVERAA